MARPFLDRLLHSTDHEGSSPHSHLAAKAQPNRCQYGGRDSDLQICYLFNVSAGGGGDDFYDLIAFGLVSALDIKGQRL